MDALWELRRTGPGSKPAELLAAGREEDVRQKAVDLVTECQDPEERGLLYADLFILSPDGLVKGFAEVDSREWITV